MMLSFVDVEGYSGTTSSTKKEMQQQILYHCTNHLLFLTL